MKFNKWTYGLAAVGAVSLASAARADEHALNTLLSSTTISGWVDVSAQYMNGNQLSGTTPFPPRSGGPVVTTGNQVDAFTLNSVGITLDKPLDESAWAAGYHIDFNLNGGFNSIRQAYVALRTPLGNGIDWKFGVWDTIIGYESATPYANPNFTRSIGWNHEATTFTGLLGTYKVADFLTVNAGIANPYNGFNQFSPQNPGFSTKNFLASAVLTAPESFGAFKGATLTLGTIQVIQSGGMNSYYAGLTLPTPIKALAFGFAFDALQNLGDQAGGNEYIFGAYVTYQATDKLGFALRGELHDDNGTTSTPNGNAYNSEEITGTISYNLWANVVSRLEVRWDHRDHTNFGNTSGFGSRAYEDNLMVAMNVIYKF
jgi:hypothetical protein